jgi:GxxExxY protein
MTQISEKDPRTYEIIGAAIEVHRIMGHGFLEAVYQEALSIEFSLRKIPFQKEVDLPIYYKDKILSTSYRADFLCYERVIVELKAISQLIAVMKKHRL